ncbi:MAG: PstS family phosphate ABC transporter substrate-binding protein [Planctomycetota bacterium]
MPDAKQFVWWALGRTSCALISIAAVACSGGSADAQLKGKVRVDGSSTVAPITMAASEMFKAKQPNVEVTVGISGTGGGFKKFLDEKPELRTDISDASRPIMPQEIKRAQELGVEFIELPIALDGLAVVVHPSNTFCDHLTIDELRRIWEPNSQIKSWSQVRKGFPDKPLTLYGPGTDSGTFDYFTEVIVGKAKASRSDYTASESDNMLVRGVEGDQAALGYFGFSYFEANKSKLRAVPIDGGGGKPIVPSLETVRSGAYAPLSRPLFLYVNKAACSKPAVKAFVEFLLADTKKIVEHPRVNYVALSDELSELARKRFVEGKSGSAMSQAEGAHVDLADTFRKY